MSNTASSNKVIPLVLDESLYELIDSQAQMAGEPLETFILNRLSDSVEAWADYCSAVSMLNNEEQEHFHVRVVD